MSCAGKAELQYIQLCGNVKYGIVDIQGWSHEFHKDCRDANVSNDVFLRFIRDVSLYIGLRDANVRKVIFI